MRTITIKRGLDLPIAGVPRQSIEDARPTRSVAVVGPDYHGLRPTMAVQVGDSVNLGQLLFTDKKIAGVRYTAPAAGRVAAVNRGEKRVLQSVVIELTDNQPGEFFPTFGEAELESIGAEKTTENLVATGLWTALRTRPFSKIPSTETKPRSLFVTAMDTNPLAPDAAMVIDRRKKDFLAGLKVLSNICGQRIHLCKAPQTKLPGTDLNYVETVQFAGPHPAGLPGTHIHLLDPVGRNKTVWTIGYQDVIAIGNTFLTGRLDTERIVSLAGPGVKQPRLLKTRLGASLEDLTEGELIDKPVRVVSGSVLSGFAAAGPLAYLGRYHQQVSVVAEGLKREIFGWYNPGFTKHSVKGVVVSSLIPGKKFNMTTALWGGRRAIVPIGSYEKVMPLDIIPNFLLRSLSIDDVEQAEALGCLELDEEDLALCTYVCPGKGDYGDMLRRNLTIIEKEG
jgi:Na+-transporting NADH:ubiquinone oxidoreductase subunit A